MNVFVSADAHVGHANIMKYEPGRDFDDVPHMNEMLVRWWNETVAPEDIVFFLGDFAMGRIDDTLPLASRLNGTKVMVYGNHDRCLSQDTRAVTRSGFTAYTDLKVGDEVLTCDDTGERRWERVERVHVFDYEGDLVHYKAFGYDGLVTPDHRVVSVAQARMTWLESSGQEVLDGRVPGRRIVTGVTNPSQDLDGVTDDELRLLGWSLSDGNLVKRKGAVLNWGYSQRASNAHKIRDILDRMGLTYSETTRVRDITHICGKRLKGKPEPSVEFRLSAGSSRSLPFSDNDRLPAWMWDVSTRQFEIFWDCLIDGDGSYRSGTDGVTQAGTVSGVLYVNVQHLRDDLRLLLTLNGYRSSTSTFNGNDNRLNFCRRTTCLMGPKTKVEAVPYRGTVWCVTVPSGRFFVEREGKIHLTGNCFGMEPQEEKNLSDPREKRWKSKVKHAKWFQKYIDVGFVIVTREIEMTFDGIPIRMCHFPYEGDHDDENVRYSHLRPVDDGRLLIHGHVHSAWKTRTSAKGAPMFNAGMDVNGYKPVLLSDAINEAMPF